MDRAKGPGVLVIHRVPPYPRLPAFSGLIYAAATSRTGLSQAHAERAGLEAPYNAYAGAAGPSLPGETIVPAWRALFLSRYRLWAFKRDYV